MSFPLQTSIALALLPGRLRLTMSSREIAKLVESRHDKVKRSIKRLAVRGAITLPPLGKAFFLRTDGRKQHTTEYEISKRDSYVIVAQLSPEFTGRLVDRWQQLEEGATTLQPTIPETYSAALRLAADLADQNSRLATTVAEQKTKVIALARIAEADGLFCISDAAKALQIRPTDLFVWLNRHNWIFKQPDGGPWRAYQAKVRQGLLEIKAGISSTGKAFAQVLITPKGLTKLATLLGQKTEGMRDILYSTVRSEINSPDVSILTIETYRTKEGAYWGAPK